MKPASVGFQCPSCVKEGNSSIRQPRGQFGGRVSRGNPLTLGLIGVNVVMFLVTTVGGAGFLFGGGGGGLFNRLSLIPVLVAGGGGHAEYYRLFTSMFLHFGIVHIALNMYVLFVIGPTLERALGWWRFLTLYVLAGLAGSALSYGFASPFENAAGASGAIFGLFAAYFLFERRRGGDVSGIAVTIGINLAISFTVSFIDWRGHVGGLIGGGLVGLAVFYAPAGSRRLLVQVGGMVVVAVLVVASVVVRTHDLRDQITSGDLSNASAHRVPVSVPR